jgi:hypothetical protein
MKTRLRRRNAKNLVRSLGLQEHVKFLGFQRWKT